MSITTSAPTVDIHAERWLQWQMAYTESSRKSATRMRIVYTIALTAFAVAFGLQLLYT